MRHSKPVRFSTASTGGESVYLFFEFTINVGLFSGDIGFGTLTTQNYLKDPGNIAYGSPILD